MIMLSGMHMKFEHLMHVGKRAAAVAVVGTLLPIAVGVAALFAVGVDPFPDGLAAGVTLAPTSVGIAIKLLTERKVLKADYGQVGASAGRAGARWWCIVRVFLVMVVKDNVDVVDERVAVVVICHSLLQLRIPI